MAKRFIEPNWKELRKLPNTLRQAWFYIWDKSDNSGVYYYDGDYLKLDLGYEVTLKELGTLPECEILPGERVLIKNFLVVNYTKLKTDYNPHKPALRDIDKNKLVLNSSLNQASLKLEEEGVDEEEGKGVGKEEEYTPPQKFLIPEMQSIFKAKNIHYLPNKELDYRPLLKIAQFISAQENIEFQNRAPDGEKRILEIWSEMSGFISDHKFYGTKALSTISNQIQAICLEYGKPATGKKSNKSLDEAFAEYYSQGG